MFDFLREVQPWQPPTIPTIVKARPHQLQTWSSVELNGASIYLLGAQWSPTGAPWDLHWPPWSSLERPLKSHGASIEAPWSINWSSMEIQFLDLKNIFRNFFCTIFFNEVSANVRGLQNASAMWRCNLVFKELLFSYYYYSGTVFLSVLKYQPMYVSMYVSVLNVWGVQNASSKWRCNLVL